MEKESYNEIFKYAKQNTVYAHAMVWIKDTISDKQKTEQEQFDEINIIITEAIKHIS